MGKIVNMYDYNKKLKKKYGKKEKQIFKLWNF